MAYRQNTTITNDDHRRAMLGAVGERIVAKLFREQGRQTRLADSTFDRRGDVFIDDEPAEVKTQELWHRASHPMHGTKASFTIKPNQLEKCMNAPRWIFINVKTGLVYLVDPHHPEFESFRDRRRDGQLMICIPVEQPALTVIGQANKSMHGEMMSFCTTTWED